MTAILVFTASAQADQQQNATPSDLVQTFQQELITVMKLAEDGKPVAERYQTLISPIRKTFHLPLMSRIVVGDAWGNATPSQQRDLVEAFQRMNGLTLATLLSGYSGEVFETVGIAIGPQNTKIVSTKVIATDGESHDLSYVVHTIQGRNWIIDVIVDGGISELTTRRSEYRAFIQQGGVDALIQELNGKADTLVADQSS